MKAKVKLFPAVDIPKVGMYAKIGGKLQTIKHVNNDLSVVTQDESCVEIEDVRLHKAYVLKGNNLLGELAFADYCKCEPGKLYEFKVIQKLLRVPVGTKVRIVKLHVRLCTFDKVDLFNLTGVVTKVSRNDYEILLDCGKLLPCKREYFVSLDTKNEHNICYLAQ